MKKAARLLLLLALAVPAAALAQGGPPPDGNRPQRRMPGPGEPDGRMPGRGGSMMGEHERTFGTWWRDSELAKQIELTPDQTKQIEQKFLDSRLKLINERADLETQETLLQPMMEEDRPDEARVGAQLDKVVAARGRLEKENAMMMLSIRRVLSVEQWKKLQQLQHERARGMMMRMREPGGPDGRERPPAQPPPRRPGQDGPQTPDGPRVPDAPDRPQL